MQSNPLTPVTERFPPLAGDLRTEVLVVGGGVAGIASAYHLAKAGFEVAVIEGDELGSGATGASSGILYYGSGTTLEAANGLFGPQRAHLLWHESRDAIDGLVRLAQRLSIPCGLRLTEAIVVASDESGLAFLERERAALARIGFDGRALSSTEVGRSFPLAPFRGGLLQSPVHQIYPGLFAAGLARAEGLRLYEGTPLVDHRAENGAIMASTPRGAVRCRHLLVCTNLRPLYGLEAHFAEESSTILASEPLPEAKWRAVFPDDRILWTTEEEYDILYAREGRLVLEVYRLKGFKEKFARYFPGIAGVGTARWGDSWSKAGDRLPIVGTVAPGVHVAVAMGDQGIVMGFAAGRRAPKVIRGEPDPFLELVSPARFQSGGRARV